ncbi:TetR/AcrR family transcriptional regulator, partial [Nocardia salmonicida]|uniref:TetR/AcrR family transcriptional regulator n=1 Tax=Nocardia salmonicida TaxID=53431 RepID=UPI0033E221E7
AVLDAALELFGVQGYAHTTIEQLCQASFVSTRSFYDLFGSREGCYQQLIDQVTSEIQDEMLGRFHAMPQDEPSATAELLSGFVATLTADVRRVEVVLGPGRAITVEAEQLRRTNRLWAAGFVESVWRHFGVEGDHRAIAVGLIGGMYDMVGVWLLDRSLEGDLKDGSAELLDSLSRFYSAIRRGLDA